MADQVQSYSIDLVVSQVSTSLIYVDKYDQLMIEIPKIVGAFASSPVAFTLQGSYMASGTPRQMHYYDYVSNAPNTCVVTVSTGGIYELPYPGALNQVSLAFDVAVSQATSVKLIGPKTTY